MKPRCDPSRSKEGCGYSKGYRPSATQALEAIREAGNRGHNFVDFNSLRSEIRSFTNSIREAGVMEDGTVQETLAGTLQGGVISPLLANIYLNKLDRIWVAKCSQLGILVRYAHDFVAVCATESRAREALRRIGLVMDRLGLRLHPTKTRRVDLRGGKESFVFLGCTIRRKRRILRAAGKHFMQRWPSPKATKKMRGRVRELTDARQSGKDVKQIIAELNPVLRGWGNYFRTGNAGREFHKIDGFVYRRLQRWQQRRGGQRATRQRSWTSDQLWGMGLYKLQGTVRYPSPVTSRRSSVSCVRENRTHSLKGGYMETGQQ